MNRREFLAGAGGLGVGLGLGAISNWFPLDPPRVGAEWSPGRTRFVPSTCLLCPARCGIRGRVVDGALVSIEGNPLHPSSRGGLCPKGVAGIQMLYSPARITGPIERTGPPGSSEFRKITWDDAIQRVAGHLDGARSGGRGRRVAWMTGDVTGVMKELIDLFSTAAGFRPPLREDYADGSGEVMRLSQGLGALPAFDLSASDLILSFGASLSEAWPSMNLAAASRAPEQGRRPRLIQVDSRLSRTAARADEFVSVRPGTHGALALGLIYVIMKEGLYDAEKISREVSGIEHWPDREGPSAEGLRSLVLKHGRTERISRVTGVPSQEIVRIAKRFSTASHPVALWDQSVAWRTGGLADALAIHALNIIMGALNRPGGILVQPPLPVPPLDPTPDRGGKEPDGLTVANWAERVSSGEGEGLEALLLYCSNPVASSPDGETVARALSKIPLVVSFSPFLDETAKHAHLVLPDHTYLERWQDAPAPASTPISVWGVVQPMTEALHDTRATGDLILRIASQMSGDMAETLPWSSMEEIVTARGKSLASANRGSTFVPRFRREELREMEARGWWLPHGMTGDEFWESIRETGGWFDPHYDYNDRSVRSGFEDGRAKVFSPEARELISSRVPGLEGGFLPVPAAGVSEEADTAYPLRLLPYRVMTLASGGTTLMPWLLENLGVMTGDAWEAWAEVNPATGGELGLSPGQRVRIESAAGSFEARLRFFEGAQPGVLNVPYGLHSSVEGWGRCAAANPLTAIGNRRDPSTGLPDWYSSRVRVVPI